MDSNFLSDEAKTFFDFLTKDVFVENILVTSIIIFEFLNARQPFLYSVIITFVVSTIKIYKNTFISTILTYNLFKHREFKNFSVMGTINLLIALGIVIYFSYMQDEIRVLTILIFIVFRAFLALELHYVQDTLTFEVVNSILHGYNFHIPEAFENNYLRKVAKLMEDYKSIDRKRVEENLKNERLKVDLITNISHDLKTPLTSIINYADLLSKKSELDDEAVHFIEVLNRNSKRLKTLISDLIFASKASSKNIAVEKSLIEMNELINQVYGQYDYLFKKHDLDFVYESNAEDILVYTDVNLMVRILENLFSNICKYSKESTRVYASLIEVDGEVNFLLKNLSEYELNISAEELFEELVKGDASRHAKGSGLGLHIVRDLVNIIGGEVSIDIDGDYFKVYIKLKKDIPN
ncbi:sensor histidine kinase [Peptoniphilus sp.]|jgi:signal transduction histidine kinase|uniref:sensor histidine kinase n=1 Tax=Peptoniphilus sp. TaxID=1971214 RepID=UPI003D943108